MRSHVRLFDSFCPDYDEASATALTLKVQIGSQSLRFRTHYLSKSCFNMSNSIVFASAVPVNHLKLQPLFFLKEVIYSEPSFEVRVEVILDLLGLPEPHPLIRPIVILTQDADRVRFAENIEILEVTAGNEHLNFHRKVLSTCIWFRWTYRIDLLRR